MNEGFDDLCFTIWGFDHNGKTANDTPGFKGRTVNYEFGGFRKSIFSQRGRCHGGANKNPKILAYSKTMNTMIITEDRIKSSKHNSATKASIGGAHPYNLLAKKSFRLQ